MPIFGREGDNTVIGFDKTPRHHGPTLLKAAGAFEPMPEPVALPLRIPVHDVYKFDTRRIYVGDEILFRLRTMS